ncbi:mu-like prophage FluMu gp41 family protein [Burkholderia pseudomallei ABCPW 107]|uniref:phage tail assembly protein n=1 Tax=Burkholderia pseudomallei TaxID=28450 RepID=UPI00053113D0|nr:phage tail assembly protein [Burkholderia pseudomallei]KGS37269.1 mu-like prophage FluMu gp41 family protein [Burkholderia pseudomallei ABCPW 107]
MDTITIKLEYPITLDGVLRDTLTMRRPKVRDVRGASKRAQDDDELREITLFAMLADVAPDELEQMDMADYVAMQRAYDSFRPAGAAARQNGQGAGEAAAA